MSWENCYNLISLLDWKHSLKARSYSGTFFQFYSDKHIDSCIHLNKMYVCIVKQMYVCIGKQMYVCIGKQMYVCIVKQMPRTCVFFLMARRSVRTHSYAFWKSTHFIKRTVDCQIEPSCYISMLVEIIVSSTCPVSRWFATSNSWSCCNTCWNMALDKGLSCILVVDLPIWDRIALYVTSDCKRLVF